MSDPTSTVVTPNGLEIAYFVEDKEAKVKRHYEIRQPNIKIKTEGGNFESIAREWRTVPSVSTVVDILGKDALAWWGMRIGIQGVHELFSQGALKSAQLVSGGLPVFAVPLGDGLVAVGPKRIEELLKEHKLTTNQVRDAAGDRGTSAHTALELWAQNGEIPDPEMFPPHERGYIVALRMFLQHLEVGEPEIIASERMVASLEHGFAGRYDLEIRTHKPCTIAKHWTPKRGPQWATLEPGLYVPDLKTSKGVYESHCVQLEGYELGRVECGYDPSDERLIIHVHSGDPGDKKLPDAPFYRVVKSWAQPEVFLAALNLYRSLEHMKENK